MPHTEFEVWNWLCLPWLNDSSSLLAKNSCSSWLTQFSPQLHYFKSNWVRSWEVNFYVLDSYSCYLLLFPLFQMCHKHGVMHRDLKPENFLFGNKKENAPLKAIDFGLSVFFKPGMLSWSLCLFLCILLSICSIWFLLFMTDSTYLCGLLQVKDSMKLLEVRITWLPRF